MTPLWRVYSIHSWSYSEQLPEHLGTSCHSFWRSSKQENPYQYIRSIALQHRVSRSLAVFTSMETCSGTEVATNNVGARRFLRSERVRTRTLPSHLLRGACQQLVPLPPSVFDFKSFQPRSQTRVRAEGPLRRLGRDARAGSTYPTSGPRVPPWATTKSPAAS